MTTIKQYNELTNISNVGITNNRLVRESISSVGLVQIDSDNILANDLITNDFNITNESTDQAITDILLKEKHKKISKEIENYINNI